MSKNKYNNGDIIYFKAGFSIVLDARDKNNIPILWVHSSYNKIDIYPADLISLRRDENTFEHMPI